MIFSKYSNPLVLLDRMIATRRLREFVNEFLKIHNEDTEERAAWDVWLHKVIDMDFPEFLSRLNNKTAQEEFPSHDALEATVKESMGIINSFCPS